MNGSVAWMLSRINHDTDDDLRRTGAEFARGRILKDKVLCFLARLSQSNALNG
jgi:hypothetical protein